MTKNSVFRKRLVIGIIILFIGASVMPSITGYDKDVEKTDYLLNENETIEMKNDDYKKQMIQTIKNGIKTRDDWLEPDKLLPSDGAADDNFGVSVSIDGGYAIIGTHHDDDNGENSGSAYVFKRDGATWSQQAKLLASDGAEDDFFGYSVSIDGDYALIGAGGDDDNGDFSGSAYIFTRSGATWTEQAKLLASDGAANNYFGAFVSIDGDDAIIGAWCDDDNGFGSGSAYIFNRSGTTWTEQAKLLASDGAAEDWFGHSVSIDGDYALIGAVGDDDNGDRSGSAYIFTRSGTTWTEQYKLLASDGEEFDSFGGSVSIDGNYAIIGASNDDDNGDFSGSAYVFKRDGATWSQQAKLLASDGAEDDFFGYPVSIDGDDAIIGAWCDDDNGDRSGSAYVFKREDTSWIQEVRLIAPDGAEDDFFGYSGSIDGDYVIIGAWADDDNGDMSGSAYVYRKNQPPYIPTINGPTEGYVGVEYPFCISTIDPEGDDVYYYIDWGDDSNSSWLGPNNSGEIITVSHTWSEIGSYEIRAKAKDTFNAESEWSDVYVMTIVDNQPPNKPDTPWKKTISTKSYTFCTKTTDPDDDQVFFWWDWDDGTNSGWIGPVDSGEVVCESHIWDEKGTYTIRVKAKDTFGAESDWAELSVTMPRNKAIMNTPFLNYLQNFLQQYPILYQLLLRFLRL